LAWPATGRTLPAMSEGGDDVEYRKRITAMLCNGPSVILIDNVRRPLDSGALAGAITSTVWEDRILGHSRTARLAVRCAWVATANNPVLSNEMARRAVRSHLDARIERPWLERQFRHPNLMDWVTENRSELVWANLVLIQAWIAAGQPEGSKKLGMFERWSAVMGGILQVAGIPGFLGNLDALYEQTDPESDAFCEFIENWWRREKMRECPVGADDLLDIANESLDLGSGTEQSQKIKLGKLLASNRNRQFGPLHLERAEKRQGSWQWRLVSITR